MAKYNVVFSCGHSGRVQLFGPYSKREWQIKNMEESGLCPECEEKQRNKETEDMAHQAAQDGLCELKGTPKQVHWALSIRNKFLKSVSALPMTEAGAKALIFLQQQIDSASWWIDERDDSPQTLLINGYKEMIKKSQES